MESGALSPYLWHALTATGLPVVCIEARHAHKTLSEQLNKTDKHDARGIAQLVRTNFFKEVKVKSMTSHQVRTLLGERAQLVGMGTALKNTLNPFSTLCDTKKPWVLSAPRIWLLRSRHHRRVKRARLDFGENREPGSKENPCRKVSMIQGAKSTTPPARLRLKDRA